MGVLRLAASLILAAGALGLPAGRVAPAAAAMPQLSRVGLGGNPCSHATIGAAIAAAAEGDTVYLAPATYNEVLGTVDKDLLFTAATADCTSADPAAANYNYVIDGGGAAGFNGGVVTIAANRTVTFTKVILQNALAVNGGIVYVAEGATATFNTVRLRDGTATNLGGLVYVAPTAALYVNGSSFLERGRAGNAGGGLYSLGHAEFLNGAAVLASEAPLGGGAALAGAGQLTLQSGSDIGAGLSPNSAGSGGGVYLTGQSRLTLRHGSTIRWNTATVGNGGGVFASGAVIVELHDSSRIYGNATVDNGGGVYAEAGATLTLDDSSQVGDSNPANGNRAVQGGGVYADDTLSLVISDAAAVRHNSAGDGGGGLYLAGGAVLSMTGGLIAGNTTTGWGGGLAIALGQAILTSAVISGNQAQIGGGVALDNAVDNALVGISAQIISNTANLDGGGVHAQDAAVVLVDMDGTARVAGNHAGQNGGGLFRAGGENLSLGTAEVGGRLAIEANTAAGDGGGLYAEGAGHVFILGEIWITGNTALGHGGGWYQDGGDIFAGGASLSKRLQVAGNTAENGHGGGLYFTDVDSGPGDNGAVVGNISVHDNWADQDGGGLYVAGGTYLRLANALVFDNQAGQDGGGVLVSAARLAIGVDPASCQNALLPPDHYCSELRNNATSANGGAVALELAAEFSLDDSAVISNSATLGSGVMSSSDGDHLEITNSLFSLNTGKTLYLAHDAFLDLVHTTLAGNGWALDINDNGAAANLQNNLIWGNGFGVESAVALGGGCSISQNSVGGVKADPLFHSTGRGAYRLASGSPAIDACAIGVAADLDGLARPQGAQHDMGAFEAGRSLLLWAAQLEVLEGDTGLTPAPFVVSLSETSTQTITVDVAAVGVHATAGADFSPLAQTLSFAPGTLTQTVPLAIVGESVYEGDETLELQLSNAAAAELTATTAEVVILNDDGPPALTVASVAVSEGHSGLSAVGLTVNLSRASAFTITAEYATSDGLATAGADYTTASGTVTFLPGALTAEITVWVAGDALTESDEQFQVGLSGAVGAAFASEAATVTILNDDFWRVFIPLVRR